MSERAHDKAAVEPGLVTQSTDTEARTHAATFADSSLSKEAFVNDVVHIRTSSQEEKRVLRKIDW